MEKNIAIDATIHTCTYLYRFQFQRSNRPVDYDLAIPVCGTQYVQVQYAAEQPPDRRFPELSIPSAIAPWHVTDIEQHRTIMASVNKRLLGSATFPKFIRDRYGSVENLISRARSGAWEAQQDLGFSYSEGVEELSIRKDTDKAIGWLTSAVDNGSPYPSAIHQLATLLDVKGREEGSSVLQRRAYELYHKAAESGCAHSQFNLAEIYRCGVEGK